MLRRSGWRSRAPRKLIDPHAWSCSTVTYVTRESQRVSSWFYRAAAYRLRSGSERQATGVVVALTQGKEVLDPKPFRARTQRGQCPDRASPRPAVRGGADHLPQARDRRRVVQLAERGRRLLPELGAVLERVEQRLGRAPLAWSTG